MTNEPNEPTASLSGIIGPIPWPTSNGDTNTPYQLVRYGVLRPGSDVLELFPTLADAKLALAAKKSGK